ncbi:acetyltransferase [Flavobacterium sp. MAH-1]|uniref:Acetyltransferase n=1 Tax=Flavobacterium agri TaxID=2743471 RepID=A0A7Y9C5A3_9FLAO|nr:acetyltransferase [Flavobacterium agri]NUY80134.1 acetyltransferase [Flavobacterium agri]NYA70159.1 acetyltransferase [Flavobacterium agri]
MSKILGIIGSGHLGQQLAHFALSGKQYDKVVFFDDLTSETHRNSNEILGKTDQIANCFAQGAFHELLIGIGYNHMQARRDFYERFYAEIPFGKLIHATSWVDPTATIAPGSVLYPGCCIDANVKIAENALLNLNCTVSHDCSVGAHSFLAPRVALAGFVSVGDGCFLGINTTVKDNISINSGTSSGACTLFVKDTPESGLYIGQPAKKIA